MKTKVLKRWAAIAGAAVLGISGAAYADDQEPGQVNSPSTPGMMEQDAEGRPTQGVPDWEQPAEKQGTNLKKMDETQTTGVAGDATKYNSQGISKRAQNNQIGLANLRVGGGIEVPTASLRDDLAVGSLWSAAIAVQPWSFMGIEAGYSGSTFEVDDSITGPENDGATNGADFVRNGGYVAATVNIPFPYLQPYALGGVGIDRVNYRADDNAQFRDDTAGRVPIGGGLRATVGPVLADLRVNYNVLFDQDFARTSPDDKNGGNYDVGLQVGAQF